MEDRVASGHCLYRHPLAHLGAYTGTHLVCYSFFQAQSKSLYDIFLPLAQPHVFSLPSEFPQHSPVLERRAHAEFFTQFNNTINICLWTDQPNAKVGGLQLQMMKEQRSIMFPIPQLRVGWAFMKFAWPRFCLRSEFPLYE